MAYGKHNFQSGDILYALQLNEMEEQISSNEVLLQEIIDILNYEEIKINLFNVSNSNSEIINEVEIGTEVNNIYLNYSLNKLPSVLTLSDNSNTFSLDLVQANSILLEDINLTTNRTWTLTATDEKSNSTSVSTTFYFLKTFYYGVASSNTTVNNSFLLNLAGQRLMKSKQQIFNVTAGTGQYIYVAVPSSYGAYTFTNNETGFKGGFRKINTFNHENNSGHTESYDVYCSDNESLGFCDLTIS